MTKRAVHSVHPLGSVVALCLVLLQLVSALHFALVPHRFGAGLSGFVHLHRVLAAQPEQVQPSPATRRTPNRPTLVAAIAVCAPDACPLGFSGPASRPVAASSLCSLLWLPTVREHISRDCSVRDRSRALLSAPKTSPPLTV
ncbi:MAG: hypothetical protein WDO74_05380 [Pseudomonadota bacterium]